MAQPQSKVAIESEFDHDAVTEEDLSDLRRELCDMDGLLTAVAISPVFVPPGEWLPALLGDVGATELPAQAKAMMRNSLDNIHRVLRGAPQDYLPMYMDFEPDAAHAAAWAKAFLDGIELKHDAWEAECRDSGVEDRLTLFALLGTNDKTLTRMLEDAGKPVPEDLDELRLLLAEEVPDCIVWLYRHWHGKEGAKGGSPMGRNDPCPCGSGKKYKKCCLA